MGLKKLIIWKIYFVKNKTNLNVWQSFEMKYLPLFSFTFDACQQQYLSSRLVTYRTES